MADALLKDNDFNFTDMPVGEVLRRTRMHYGRSLQDVERDIRIRSHLIEAIEENHTEVLPARVYAIGFVRSYSEYLGLDGGRMVDLFKKQAGEKVRRPEVAIPMSDEDYRTPPLWLVTGSVIFVLVVAIVWANGWTKSREAIETIPNVPTEMQESAFVNDAASAEEIQPPKDAEIQQGDEKATIVADEQTNPSAEKDASEPTSSETARVDAAAEAKGGIILNIRDNSWVEIRDQNGNRLISRVLKAGDRYFVPNRPDLMMSLGNAGGVEVLVDGIILRPLGRNAQVRRNIQLDVEHLKNTYVPEQ